MSEEYLFHTWKKSDLFSYPYRMERGELLFCLQGGVQLYINQQPMDGTIISIVVSLSAGALLANIISVILLIGETLKQSR